VTRAAVFGTGSWGTAFAAVLADAGTDVVLCGRDPDLCDVINRTHENPVYHPGIELPLTLKATSDAGAALADADLVVLAIPAQVLRSNLAAWVPALPDDSVLVSLMKGIELGTAKRMSEVISDTADVPLDRVAVVSGPNLAREIALRQPAASVVACSALDVADRLQVACHTPYFRPYTNVDVVGCELGGAVKNVIALAVGMAVGMGLGANAQASLITRGLAETARLGTALGADPMTFAGLAGLGDLVATCSSPLSRNRTFGENLGHGMSLEEVVAITSQTAEGVKTCQSVLDLAQRHSVDVPIIEAVVAVVRDGASPTDVVEMLMSRTPKAERHGH